MEYVDVGLADIITNEDVALNESQIAYVLQQLLIALNHIHSLGRIHRDIRADNVLLSMQGLVKLGQCSAQCLGCPRHAFAYHVFVIQPTLDIVYN